MTSEQNQLGTFLSKEELAKLLEITAQTLVTVSEENKNVPVAPLPPLTEVKARLTAFDFLSPTSPQELLKWTIQQMTTLEFQFSDPHYFGVFNPNPTAMGIIGDLLASVFNSQLASAISSPFGVLVEAHLIDFFSTQLGMKTHKSGGIFTSGGTEANYTAVLCALHHACSDFERKGLTSITPKPILYVSTETHHSFLKAAKMAGLGLDAVREIPVTPSLTMDPIRLRAQIETDRNAGARPFLIVGTLGSTSAAAIDPLKALNEIAKKERCWFHIDAAWAGAIALLPEMQEVISPCQDADSLCLDAHKWLNVPMTAGMLLCRDASWLHKSFRVDPSPYMPIDTEDVMPPYHCSLQWSRRFVGLKLFLSLAAHGIEGYQKMLRHQIAMGNLLRQRLLDSGWTIHNETPLPVVCFTRENLPSPEKIAADIARTGKAWITTTQLTYQNQKVLRAGIANAMTNVEHIDTLVSLLNSAWEEQSCRS